MVVESVRVHMLSSRHVVILKETDRERYLPIWIGPWEASAIAMKLQGLTAGPTAHPRPVRDRARGARRRGSTGSSSPTSPRRRSTPGSSSSATARTVEVDARPSDALALAVRAGGRIFAAEAVLEQAALGGRRRTSATRSGEDGGVAARDRPASRSSTRGSTCSATSSTRSTSTRRPAEQPDEPASGGWTGVGRRPFDARRSGSPALRRRSAEDRRRRGAARARAVRPQPQAQRPEVADGPEDDLRLRAGRRAGRPRVVRHADLDDRPAAARSLISSSAEKNAPPDSTRDALERRRAGRACRRSRRRGPGGRRRSGSRAGRARA